MKSLFKILALTLSLVLPCGSAEAVKNFHGTVTKVIDGDSIKVKSEAGSFEIRLYGIDAPEYDQDYAAEAKKKVKETVYRKRVKVIPIEWDRYNRLVAIVEFGDNATVNELLLQSGLAWYYPKYCRKRVCGRWKKSAREARDKRLNIWSATDPVAPWRWKKRKYR